jgi:site-specific DNA-methyltransferase (adenine-specific)
VSEIIHGNCLEVLKSLDENSIDAIVTDPPYELGFMGKSWDKSGIAFNTEVWSECLRVLKPGGHMLAFGGSRTFHRIAVAIEDAGFELRDTIMWVYGSGFPKSHDVSEGIDKMLGKEAEREIIGYKRQHTKSMFDGGKPRPATLPATLPAARWQGWGTALKPAFEPIILAKKPISEKNIAENVLKWGTGGINIDDCRVETSGTEQQGRWPANFIHDGSEEVLRLFPETNSNSAARFFYCAKASKRERNKGCEGLEAKNLAGSNKWTDVDYRKGNGEITAQPQKNHHPTVKPLSLMQYLIRLVTPPNGTVLDPFAGSGSTLVAAVREQFKYVGIELNEEYIEIAKKRLADEET